MKRILEGTTVAVAGTRYGALTIEEQTLAPIGCRIAEGPGADAASLVRLCRGAAGIIVGSIPHFTAGVITKLEGCRVIARAGVGLDNIDLKAARKMGIAVTYVPDYCIEEVSDHAMAFILNFARKLDAAAEEVREGGWGVARLRPIAPLRGATLGVVGIGRIGAALIRKARAFGMRILAFDPFAGAALFRRLRAEKVTLARLLKEADYVSLHAPLTPKTRDLMNAAAFRRMKPEAVLVNVARGELIDEKALAAALRKGEIRAAGLDVLRREPPPRNHPLRGLPGCIITPHSAWYSTAAQEDMRRKSARDVLRVLTGKKPKYPAPA